MPPYDDALNQWQQKKPPVRRMPGQQKMTPPAPAGPVQPIGGPPSPPTTPPTMTGQAMGPGKRLTYPQGQGTRNIQPGMQPPPPSTPSAVPLGGGGWGDWLEDAVGSASEKSGGGMSDFLEDVIGSASEKSGAGEIPGFSASPMPGDIEREIESSRMAGTSPSGTLWNLPPKDYRPEYGQGVGDLFNEIFEGGEASFDPQREAIESGMHDQLARLAEQMASMGMGSSGIEASLGGQVAMDAAQLEATQFQEWYQQQVENKMGAASMMFQDDWKKMDLEHQETMAELMFELDRKRELGNAWESGLGDAQMRMLMTMLANPELSDEAKNMMRGIMEELFGADVVAGWMGEPDGGGTDTKSDWEEQKGTGKGTDWDSSGWY